MMGNYKKANIDPFFRSCVRFLKGKKSGMWHQKALDLDLPPAPPRYIFLRKSGGIEKAEHHEEDTGVGSEPDETGLDVGEEMLNFQDKNIKINLGGDFGH